MTVQTPNGAPKTVLTLSAAPSPDLELARDQAFIERELERIDRARSLGLIRLADERLDRLFDQIIAPDHSPITESELRLLDGNR